MTDAMREQHEAVLADHALASARARHDLAVARANQLRARSRVMIERAEAGERVPDWKVQEIARAADSAAARISAAAVAVEEARQRVERANATLRASDQAV